MLGTESEHKKKVELEAKKQNLNAVRKGES